MATSPFLREEHLQGWREEHPCGLGEEPFVMGHADMRLSPSPVISVDDLGHWELQSPHLQGGHSSSHHRRLCGVTLGLHFWEACIINDSVYSCIKQLVSRLSMAHKGLYMETLKATFVLKYERFEVSFKMVVELGASATLYSRDQNPRGAVDGREAHGIRYSWLQIPPPPLTCCAVISKSLYLSEPQFLHTVHQIHPPTGFLQRKEGWK